MLRISYSYYRNLVHSETTGFNFPIKPTPDIVKIAIHQGMMGSFSYMHDIYPISNWTECHSLNIYSEETHFFWAFTIDSSWRKTKPLNAMNSQKYELTGQMLLFWWHDNLRGKSLHDTMSLDNNIFIMLCVFHQQRWCTRCVHKV